MTTFGPQLIGETEKTLNALLRRLLAHTGLDESRWVTLRIAGQNDADTDLAALVATRAHFPDSAALVDDLAGRGLLDGHRLSEAGQDLVAGVQAQVAATTRPIWEDLPADDVAAAERILNTVVARGRQLLD